MADNKKYYWLKLNENFFDDDTILFIESQDNGILYSNFYLKLCLKSLKTNGKLIRLVGTTLIPYNVKSLAEMTRIDVDTVRVAMDLFKKIGLVELLETGEIYLSQIHEMIGSETDKAKMMRRLRAEKNAEKLIGNNVTEMLPKRYTEIDIENRDKEKDIEKDNTSSEDDAPVSESKNKVKHKYGKYQHVLLTDEEKEKLVNKYGELKTEKAITYLDESIEMKGYKYKSHYLAMKRWVFDAIKKSEKQTSGYTLKNGVETNNPFIAMLDEERSE